jgi:hypothetical protein
MPTRDRLAGKTAGKGATFMNDVQCASYNIMIICRLITLTICFDITCRRISQSDRK